MFTKCWGCGTRWGVKARKIDDRPGGGSTYYYCEKCYQGNLPKLDFHKRSGVDVKDTWSKATHVRYIGTPSVTGRYGNVYGSVLAEYSDGSVVGVCCLHGGSDWLCAGCADGLVKE